MLPMPLTSVWSSRARLRPVRRRRRAPANAASSNSGSSGSRAMCATGSGSPAGSVSTSASPPNVRWSTKRSSGPPSVNDRRTRRCTSSGEPGGRTRSCPLMPRWASTASPASLPSVPPLPPLPGTASSGSQRYLPRRCAPASVRPVRRAAKSAEPAAWRRTARGWPTATAATVRPAAQRSSPRRTTSTSGSSGSASPLRAGAVGAAGPTSVAGTVLGQLGPQSPPGGRRGLLLGLLLAAPPALAVVLAGHPRYGREQLLVVRTGLRDDVLRDAHRGARRELLQAGLPVQAGAQRRGLLDQRVEQPVHQCRGLGQPAADVHRAEHRLEGVGEDRGLVAAAGRLLAAAEPDVVAEAQLTADLGQRTHVDHGGAQLGQLPLGELGVAAEER